MKAIRLVILIMLICPVSIFAQDVHFSQIASNTLMFNPANTGNFNGTWRFGHSFRSQWKSVGQAYNTISFSFDKSILIKNKKFYAGIYLLDDKSGIIGLHKSGILLSGATKFYLFKGIIRLGIQAGIINLSYDLNNSTVPGQYDHLIGAFNSNLPYNEPNIGESKMYPDINTGFTYRVLIGKFNAEIGSAIFHLNKPNNSFFENDKLNFTYKTQFKINFPVGDNLIIEPSAYYIAMSQANNLLLGSSVKLDVPKNRNRLHSIFFGAYTRTGFDRNTDAIIAVLGANLFQFRIALSYDINISELEEATNNRGAFELSLIYSSFGRKINPATIPCFRQ